MAAKPGERRLQILQTLASMLETPKGEKITTAALASKLDCSEAALYRHFASKAQMFEGLIEFIERSLFSVINQITSEESQGFKQVETIIGLLLRFAQKNRGMTRVLIGDALVNENERLQFRINTLLDKVEATINSRCASPPPKTTSNRMPTSVRWPTCYVAMLSGAGSNMHGAASVGNR